MTGTSRILAVVTARGGSKGLPGKNKKELAGKPLIAYTINAALSVMDLITDLIVSTDDPEIAEISRSGGASVPFMRPDHLSDDTASSLAVLEHATLFMEEQTGLGYDWILTLQPTSPLRNADDLRGLIEATVSDAEATSGLCIYETPAYHPLKMKTIDNGYLKPFMTKAADGIRRQDLSPPAYRSNGAGYLTKRDTLMIEKSLFGPKTVPYVMPNERSVDIDTGLDFKLAELIMAETRC